MAFRSGELEALLWSGAFDELAGLRPSDYPWVHEALWGELSRGRFSSLDGAVAEARRRIPTHPPQAVARYSCLCRVQRELRYLGMHISNHPMGLLRAEAERLSCVTSECLSQYVDRVVRFAGVVAATRNVAVTERDAVQFITLEDEYGLVEARLSPQAWKRFHPLLSTPGPYLLQGRVHQCTAQPISASWNCSRSINGAVTCPSVHVGQPRAWIEASPPGRSTPAGVAALSARAPPGSS